MFGEILNTSRWHYFWKTAGHIGKNHEKLVSSLFWHITAKEWQQCTSVSHVLKTKKNIQQICYSQPLMHEESDKEIVILLLMYGMQILKQKDKNYLCTFQRTLHCGMFWWHNLVWRNYISTMVRASENKSQLYRTTEMI